MKIILSPAKKMKVDTDSIDTMSSPVFLEKTEEILGGMQGRTEEELRNCGNAMIKLRQRILNGLRQ